MENLGNLDVNRAWEVFTQKNNNNVVMSGIPFCCRRIGKNKPKSWNNEFRSSFKTIKHPYERDTK